MIWRNKVSLILIIISLVVLYPGLFFPIMTVKIAADLPLIGEVKFYEQTQSIIDSIEYLYENDNRLVAFLILFFSVLVPLLKAVFLLMVLFIKKLGARYQLYKFVHSIGKWSMADVFVVGVLIAYLATASEEYINAYLHDGFYYFLAYCLISLASIQVMSVKPYE